MSAEQTTPEAIEQRLDELAAQLGIVQTMTATAVAIMVRMAGEDYAAQILDELRRNNSVQSRRQLDRLTCRMPNSRGRQS